MLEDAVSDSQESTTPNLICVGVIIAAHGIKGDVKIKSFTEVPKNIVKYGPLTDVTGESAFQIKIKKIEKNFLIGSLLGVNERSSAESLKGLKLFIFKKYLPATKSDEFYYSQLIGLRVKLENGKTVGKISGVKNFGAGDLLEVTESKGTEMLIPFTQEIVPEVNIKSGVITISPPEGLLD